MLNSLQSDPTDPITEQAGIIFVTGASRSGTTMLSRVLGNHSRIIGLNELHYFGDLCDVSNSLESLDRRAVERLAATLFARQARGIWGKPPSESDFQLASSLAENLRPDEYTAAGVFSAVLGRFAAQAGKEIACEQTPRNIFYAQKLLAAYPNAYVVHMMRDPRAVLASQKNRWQMRRLGGRNVPLGEVIRSWFNYHPVTMCRLWIGSSEAALRLKEHPRFMILRFEDVLSEPEYNVRELCAFLRLDFEQDMLSVPQWGSSNISHSEDKKGMSKEMLDKWVDILSEGEITICEYMTRAYMKQFSYAPIGTGKLFAASLLSALLWYPIHVAGALLTNPRRVWIQLKAVFQVATR